MQHWRGESGSKESFGQVSSYGRHDLAKTGLGSTSVGNLDLRATLTRLLCGLAFGVALTGPAAAAEQVVMPFSCRVAGGQVMLAPSAPQAYQIYGSREQKRMTTCSPYDRRKCHNWSVHRFDLDCGGVRTSWQSVVTAMTPMLAESIGSPDNAYAGTSDEAYAPPYQARPGRAIAFPRGFAPNPMKVARFERTGPAVADIPLPPKKPESTAPSQVAASEPSSEPAIPPLPTSGEEDTATKPPSAEQKTASVEQEAAPPKHKALQIEVESEVTGALPASGAASTTLWRDASTVFTVTLAVLFALTATLFLGRRRMQPLLIPFAGSHASGTRALIARAFNSGLERAAAHTQRTAQPQNDADAAAPRLRLWDEDWLPRTMLEAIDVLGVDPSASKDKMKTTVTRLRRALHPDHAIDEEDRALRERRLKQINVAWDIVSAKRRAPWLAAKSKSSARPF